jgi:hypothetical protein
MGHKGCNAWYFSDLSICSMIFGYDGPDNDAKCPCGKPDIQFNTANDKPANTGGPGPCAGSVRR